MRGAGTAVALIAGLLLAAGPAASATTERQARATTAFNSCLVGTWRETSETDRTTYNERPVTVRGGAGRVLTFSRTGREVVNYAHAAPLRGILRGVPYSEEGHGLISYQDKSNGRVLRFTHGDFAKFSLTGTYGASPVEFGAQRDAAPVTFTCSAVKQTQSATGYSATFVRAG